MFLEEMSNYLEKAADFNFDKDVAAIGTQGPDIFFFHRILPLFMPGKSQNKVGSALHRAKPGDIFDAFSEYLKITEDKDTAKSYIYGFILHYALDKTCHPYVYSLQNKLTEKGRVNKNSAHNKIEISMDAYLLNKRFNTYPPVKFSGADTFFNDEKKIGEIAKLLSFTINKVCGFEIENDVVIRSVSDTKKMQKVLRDESGFMIVVAKISDVVLAPFTGRYKFSSMIRPKDLENAKKYGNIKNKVWKSPFDGSESALSFEELFEKAKDDAKRLVEGFEAICKGEENGYNVTENISFLTGIEVK